MERETLKELAGKYLGRICEAYGHRPVGSPGNLAATQYFSEELLKSGFQVRQSGFSCLDWQTEGATLSMDGKNFPVYASPYGKSCEVTAPLTVIRTVEDLKTKPARGRIALLTGAIASEPVSPKNFKFYNPEEHQLINRLLETRGFKAVIAATGKSPMTAGALSPFPLIEDGDFKIPAAHMPEDAGLELCNLEDQAVRLSIRSKRIPAKAFNVSGLKGDFSSRRLVFTAHIDAKPGTPGALDNASGICVLLLLARLLSSETAHPPVELTAFNGEDYYCAPGEMLYLRENRKRMNSILFNINIDGIGLPDGPTAYSLYECPKELAQRAARVFESSKELVRGPEWPQSDHMVFVQNGVPAIALTSSDFERLMSGFAHTEKDTPDAVDCGKLADTALALKNLVMDFAENH